MTPWPPNPTPRQQELYLRVGCLLIPVLMLIALLVVVSMYLQRDDPLGKGLLILIVVTIVSQGLAASAYLQLHYLVRRLRSWRDEERAALIVAGLAPPPRSFWDRVIDVLIVVTEMPPLPPDGDEPGDKGAR